MRRSPGARGASVAFEAEVTVSRHSEEADRAQCTRTGCVSRIDAIENEVLATNIHQTLDPTSPRVRRAIGLVARRGNLNLTIAAATTVMTIGLLVDMTLHLGHTDNWTSLASHCIPRMTTVAFMGSVSFFFLRLYRQSLGEIRQYHNELTTLECRRAALEAANSAGDKVARRAALLAMGNAIRNGDEHALPRRGTSPRELKDVVDLLEQLAKGALSAVRRGGATLRR
jgi:hypothetical protein